MEKIFLSCGFLPGSGKRALHRKMKALLMLILLAVSTLTIEAYATQQQKAIRGKVSSETGEPIPGATVMVQGTTVGTITDFNGEFTLSVPPDARTLVISFVGMTTQELPAIPFRITKADADSVLVDKDYAVIGVKYENMLFGNYWHGGVTIEKDASG